MIRSFSRLGAAVVFSGAALTTSAAQADGYPPFYGYSPYLGRPSVYFSPESDVQQVTAREVAGFDTRTYYRGGPFWRYETVAPQRAARPYRSRRRIAILRRRG